MTDLIIHYALLGAALGMTTFGAAESWKWLARGIARLIGHPVTSAASDGLSGPQISAFLVAGIPVLAWVGAWIAIIRHLWMSA